MNKQHHRYANQNRDPTVRIMLSHVYKTKKIVSVCARMEDALTAIDWTVGSQAISLSNGSTRHCVSQHYS